MNTKLSMLGPSIVLLLGMAMTVPAFAQGQQTDAQRLARGADAWAQQCQRCHNLRDPAELSDYEWDLAVNHMRVRGNIPGNIAQDIKYFLQNTK